jgi:hypoxanthine phosphoribosyltransferase
MTADELLLLKRILPAYTESYNWMLTDIKARADEIKPDDYSPDLLLAITAKGLMDKVI